MDAFKVWEVRPLRMIGESSAREILERAAKQVQPIMQKQKWSVKLLFEISSASSPNLLGFYLGEGGRIGLRLRRLDNELEFFPYNLILDSLLHELCHIKFGPHNSAFYHLLDDLRKSFPVHEAMKNLGMFVGCRSRSLFDVVLKSQPDFTLLMHLILIIDNEAVVHYIVQDCSTIRKKICQPVSLLKKDEVTAIWTYLKNLTKSSEDDHPFCSRTHQHATEVLYPLSSKLLDLEEDFWEARWLSDRKAERKEQKMGQREMDLGADQRAERKEQKMRQKAERKEQKMRQREREEARGEGTEDEVEF